MKCMIDEKTNKNNKFFFCNITIFSKLTLALILTLILNKSDLISSTEIKTYNIMYFSGDKAKTRLKDMNERTNTNQDDNNVNVFGNKNNANNEFANIKKHSDNYFKESVDNIFKRSQTNIFKKSNFAVYKDEMNSNYTKVKNNNTFNHSYDIGDVSNASDIDYTLNDNDNSTLTIEKVYNTTTTSNFSLFDKKNDSVYIASNIKGKSIEALVLLDKSDKNNNYCINNCNGNGYCYKSSCYCKPEFKGIDCLEKIIGDKSCPNACSFNGQCLINGMCSCKDGFTGSDCSIISKCFNEELSNRLVKENLLQGKNRKSTTSLSKSIDSYLLTNSIDIKTRLENSLLNKIKKECSGNGQCILGSCACFENYHGTFCEISNKPCLNNCNNKGYCDDGVCFCDANFYGESCEKELKDCSSRGVFNKEKEKCTCESDYYGENCELQKCSATCKYGTCNPTNGQCACNEGYSGVDCGSKKCVNDCNHRGKCLNGICICSSLFEGLDCKYRKCENNCYGNGECDKLTMKCMCNKGYFGDYCENKSCSVVCLNGGKCINGECQCTEGFGGEDCSSSK